MSRILSVNKVFFIYTPVLFAGVNGYSNEIRLRLGTLIVFFSISLLSFQENNYRKRPFDRSMIIHKIKYIPASKIGPGNLRI